MSVAPEPSWYGSWCAKTGWPDSPCSPRTCLARRQGWRSAHRHTGAALHRLGLWLRGRPPMIKGSCACGGIRFEIEAVRSMTHCHCTACRKLTGASLATVAHVEKDKFRWLAGEELISRYESAPGSFRAFCRVCGSLAAPHAPHIPALHMVSR